MSKKGETTEYDTGRMKVVLESIERELEKVRVIIDCMNDDEIGVLHVKYHPSLVDGLSKIASFTNACADALRDARLTKGLNSNPEPAKANEKPKTPRKGKR